MSLSSLAAQNAKPRESFYLLTDGNGLHLLVKPNGSKLWRLRYRFGGKQNMLSLGSFPEISLADARTKRDDARKLLANGIDPSRQKKLDRIAAQSAAKNTFGAIAEEHLQNLRESGTAESTMTKNRWYLLDLASPLVDLPITEITSAEILSLLKKIEKSGRRETARKVRGAIGSVFRLAITTLRATNDPTFPLRRALLKPNVQHRPAITDETKLGALMASIDEYDGWPTIRAALQLTALTMTRPGEIRFMRRSEIVWPKAMWRIPAERMKMRRPHDVPLPTQALAIIRDIWPLSEGHELVLPSIRSPLKALSETAMNSALRRMGYTKEEVCSHGFRSSASTILNERGYDSDVVEAALAHQDEDEVRATYNRAKYWPQRIKLLQDWADLMDEFKKLSATKAAA
jgi:integrase